jgi:hypothetical protein
VAAVAQAMTATVVNECVDDNGDPLPLPPPAPPVVQNFPAPAPACNPSSTASIVVTGTIHSQPGGLWWTPLLCPCPYVSTLNDIVYNITVWYSIVYIDQNGVQQTMTGSTTGTYDQGPGSTGAYTFTFPIPVCGQIVSVSASANVDIALAYGIHGTLQLTYQGAGSLLGSTVTVGTQRAGTTCLIAGATQCFGLCPNDFENNPAPPPPQPPPPPPVQCNIPTDTNAGASQANCCMACLAGGATGYNFWASYACQWFGTCTGANSTCSCNYPPPPPAPAQCGGFPNTNAGNTQASCCSACVASGAQGYNFWASYACQWLGNCGGSNSTCSCVFNNASGVATVPAPALPVALPAN